MLSFAGALSLYHDNYLTYKDKLIYKLLENDNKWKNNLNFILSLDTLTVVAGTGR